jgi:hypothetical protein
MLKINRGASPGWSTPSETSSTLLSTCGRVPFHRHSTAQHTRYTCTYTYNIRQHNLKPARPAVAIRGEPIKRDHAIPLYRVMQPVNSGQIVFCDWLIHPGIGCAILCFRNSAPPGSALDRNSGNSREKRERNGQPLLMSSVIVTGLSLNQILESLGC